MPYRLAFLLASGVLIVACDDHPKTKVVESTELPAAGETPDGLGWQSVPFPASKDCEDDAAAEASARWIHLRGKQDQISLTIEHRLGRAPGVVLPYISFHPSGCGSTIASGDVLLIDHVDVDTLQVRNNTQEDFYLRLVLQ